MSKASEVIEKPTVRTLSVDDYGLDKSKTAHLVKSFNKFFEQASQYEQEAKSIVVTSADQKDMMTKARETRLKLKSIRVDVEKCRKSLKEQALREGKAVDGVANIIKAIIIPIEEHLDEQEKFILNAEKKQKEESIQRREVELSKYVEDISAYNLGVLTDQAYDKLLDTSKKAHEAEQVAIRKAEEERIAKEKADAEEAERIRLENEKLKKENEEKQKKLDAEKKKSDAERAAREKKEEAEKKKRDAALAKERKENEAKLAEERRQREEAEAKLQAEQDAKDKKQAEEDKAARKALLAPDKAKLIAFASLLEKIEFPNVKNRPAGKVLDDARNSLSSITLEIRARATEL